MKIWREAGNLNLLLTNKIEAMKTRVTIITEQFVSDLVQVTESTIKDIEERGAVIISVSQFHEISKYLAIMIVYKEN